MRRLFVPLTSGSFRNTYSVWGGAGTVQLGLDQRDLVHGLTSMP